MKKTLKIAVSLLMAMAMILSCGAAAFADDEPVVYYFVDCGDYLVDTVSDGDKLGTLNSVTDQFFGKDPATGMQWGVVDEALDKAASESFGDSRVITTWTWAYEYNDAGTDVPKEQSNRYCHNMTENGLDRVITYKFELPEEGEYTVEVGFAYPWDHSTSFDLYVNGSLAKAGITGTPDKCGVAAVTASPVDGFITVEGKTDMPTLNMAYIIISKVPAPEAEEEAEPASEETETAPAVTETAEPAAPAEQTAPKTGIALAVLPAIAALAAAAVTKRR